MKDQICLPLFLSLVFLQWVTERKPFFSLEGRIWKAFFFLLSYFVHLNYFSNSSLFAGQLLGEIKELFIYDY